MSAPPAINTRDEPSKPTTTTSPSTSANGTAPPPEVVLTPATPSTPLNASTKVAEPLPIPGEIKEDKMKEKEATDSQTALVGQKEQRKSHESKKSGSGTGPIDTLTRKISGRSKSSATGEKKTATSAPSEKPTTAKSPATAASSSTAANTASRSTNAQHAKKPTPKKKKRSGFSGFLLKLGCLSADEFEDPEPKKGTTPTKSTQTPGSSASTPAASKNATATIEPEASGVKAGKPSTPPTEQAVKSEQAGPSAAVLSTNNDEKRSRAGDSPTKPDDQVVVAPHEPTTAPTDETAGLTSSAVQAPGSGSALLSAPSRPSASRRQSESSPSSASPEGERTETSGGYSNISESEIPDESSGAAGAAAYPDEYGLEEEYEDDEDRLIAQGGMGIPMDENGQPAPLLRPMDPDHTGRKCLVLDLDETLLHSSFKMLPSADYIVPVEIESQTHNVYVIKRPGVDHFLTEMGKIYEVVVFTASLSKYADPVMDMLDPARVIRHRLFRESCYNHKGNYVKDLSQLGREMESSIIIDNSPASYIFHPNNAVPVSTWFNDPHDTELTDLCPFLTDLATVDDIRGVLDGSI